MSGRPGRPSATLSLVLLGAWACCGHAQSVEGGGAPDGKPVLIEDSARIFDPGSIEKATRELEEAAKKAGVPTLIETVADLRNDTIEEASLKRAMQSGREGLYVLIAKEQKKLEVRVSRRYKSVFDESATRAIRDAFLSALRADAPRAVEPGAKAIAAVLDRMVAEGKLTRPDDAPGRGPGHSLVVRNQVRLTLAGARRIVEGAEAKAAEMGLKVNIAVVDDGGHMLSFARMDGARPASGYTATTKAITAATFRQESGPLPKGATTPDVLLNLSLQNAAAASGGKLTTLHGGIPVTVEEQVIGGVGVGGGSGEQDATIARAGVASFMKQLGDAPAAKPASIRATDPTR